MLFFQMLSYLRVELALQKKEYKDEEEKFIVIFIFFLHTDPRRQKNLTIRDEKDDSF